MWKWYLACIMVVSSIVFISWRDRDEAFEVHPVAYKVKSNDTIWRIAGHYYKEQERYKDYNEWVWTVRKHNDLLGPKFIYTGQVIYIPIYKRK